MVQVRLYNKNTIHSKLYSIIFFLHKEVWYQTMHEAYSKHHWNLWKGNLSGIYIPWMGGEYCPAQQWKRQELHSY